MSTVQQTSHNSFLRSAHAGLTGLWLADNQLCGVDWRTGEGSYNATGLQAMAAALCGGCSELRSLDLASNGLCGIAYAGKGTYTGQGIRAICDGLKSNTVLTELRLSRNRIGPDGARAIAEVVRVNSTLSILDLSENAICGIDRYGDGRYDASGIQALASALSEGTATLTSLSLTDNHLKHKGAMAIADALAKEANLTELQLGNNNIGLNGAKTLANALKLNSELTSIMRF